MSQHVLITGGCGFFGAWIIKRLLEDGDRVTVFDMDLVTSRWEMLLTPEQIAKIAFVKGRVDEPAFVSAIVEAAPDAVIHLAGVQMPTCRANPVLGAQVNLVGTLNVFEAAKALREAGKPLPRIVYASSAAVFGADAEYPSEGVSDSVSPKPASHYGAFKLAAEFAARAYFLDNGVPSVGLRPLTVYGPGRDVGLTSFPTRAIASVIKRAPFEIPFSGVTVYTHVREVADIFVTAAKRDGAKPEARVYTVGGDAVPTSAFVAAIEAALPGSAALITVTGGDLPIASRIDDAALRADFPGLLRIPLDVGVAETVAIYSQMEKEGRLKV